jgi:transcriptional regulator
MYLPPHFDIPNSELHFDLIENNPLGILISNGERGLMADHVPFYLDRNQNKLLAHVAKANPQWRNIASNGAVLVVFQSGDHYITPSWYASKQEHGKVVPTWNYVAVQVTGTAKVVDDPTWLRDQIDRLTDRHEYTRARPWSTNDAPSEFVAGQLKGIIGLEIAINSTAGKWKVSQNRNDMDRLGVAEGLKLEKTTVSLKMSGYVESKPSGS